MSKTNTRPIHGILLLNKPQGLTSNAALQKVKRLFSAKKAGHTGSLDPLATGMLPICFGEATKFCQYLLDADKCYETTARLGIKTNTGDSTGEVISTVDNFTVSPQELDKVLPEFVGKILQTPSMFSALKHQGTPLYKYARAGVEIERAAREIHIHHLHLNNFDGNEFDLTVKCSKGTYIRNLIEDIGERLGPNAHVTRLHRSYTMGFAEEPMYAIEDLMEKSPEQLLQCLLPVERAVNYFPKISISQEMTKTLRQGKVITEINAEHVTGIVRLYTDGIQFIGLGEVHPQGDLTVKRLLTELVCEQNETL
jgi:tRNA pseudouridine55 synthase